MNKRAELAESYWSCQWQEGGLAFTSPAIRVCCVSHHETLGGPLLIHRYDGEKLNLIQLLEEKDTIILRNQQPARNASCAGCGMLEKKKWPVRKYPFDLINFSHFTRCNLKCSYCYIMKPGFVHSDKPYRVLPVVRDLIADKLLDPNATILWGGGEPTILEEFEDLFDLLQAHGTWQTVCTNGVVLSPAILAALPTMRGEILISIDAGTRATFKELKGVDAFDRVRQSLREYASVSREKVTAKIILARQNCGEVMEFLDCIERAGVRTIRVDVDNYAPVLAPEVVKGGSLLCKEAKRRGMRVLVGGCGSSGHPETSLHAEFEKYRDDAAGRPDKDSIDQPSNFLTMER
jgi:sulfatase maturation enzyme AslB (radical SAM superfamily)